MEGFTSVAEPKDMTYMMRRQAQIYELLKLSPAQLDRRLQWQMQSDPLRDDGQLTKSIMEDLVTNRSVPAGLKKSILDATGGTTGNVLIRQDLEPTLYALFVKSFPAFDRLAKGPAN